MPPELEGNHFKSKAIYEESTMHRENKKEIFKKITWKVIAWLHICKAGEPTDSFWESECYIKQKKEESVEFT